MNMMHTNTAHTNLTRTNMNHTNITHTTTLSRKEQEDIRRISALCRLTDGLSLSCPEDGDEYWLLEEDATAAAFLAVYKTEETMWECHARILEERDIFLRSWNRSASTARPWASRNSAL